MRNKIRATRATKLQTNGSKLPDSLDGSVTIYREGDTWHIIGRSGGRVLKERSHDESRALKYARDMIKLHTQGGLY